MKASAWAEPLSYILSRRICGFWKQPLHYLKAKSILNSRNTRNKTPMQMLHLNQHSGSRSRNTGAHSADWLASLRLSPTTFIHYLLMFTCSRLPRIVSCILQFNRCPSIASYLIFILFFIPYTASPQYLLLPFLAVHSFSPPISPSLNIRFCNLTLALLF